MDTVFDKILNKEIPTHIEYEDEKCLAFRDIAPQAPVHILVIPKKKIKQIAQADPTDTEILGHLLLIASQLGKVQAPDGFRLVINNGKDGSETVPSLTYTSSRRQTFTLASRLSISKRIQLMNIPNSYYPVSTAFNFYHRMASDFSFPWIC